MKEYPDPQEHINRHLDKAADTYYKGLEKRGLQPSQIVMTRIINRTLEEAEEDYTRRADQTHRHNITMIMREHDQDMNTIKRNGQRWRIWTCPPIALLFGFIAWLNYIHQQPAMALIYVGASLAFVAMLVLGAILDRPRN